MESIVYINSLGRSIEITGYAPFLLTKIEGTGCPNTNSIFTKSLNQDGKSYHGTTLDIRNLNVEGTIIGNSEEDRDLKKQLLSSIFNPKHGLGILRYTNSIGTKEIKVISEHSPIFKSNFATTTKFLIQLVGPNPFWSNVLEDKEEIASWIKDFEFPLELKKDGIEMGHRESKLITNIINKGDLECGIRIEFTALATVKNPSLINIYTNEFIKVKRTLNSGDRLVIITNFANKKVELIKNNISFNVFNYIDLKSTFFQLNVGDNLLKYDAESGIDNLDVVVYYKPLYVGV